MGDPYLDRRVLDLAHASGCEQLGEVALACTGECGLVRDVRLELTRGVPEHSERPQAAGGVIPDARSYDPAGAGDPPQLAEPADRVGHEVHDELRERCVERVLGERQVFGGRLLYADIGEALTGRLDERRRGIDGRHRRRPESSCELARQGAWAAADVEHSAEVVDAGEVRKRAGERRRVAAHEPVVRAGCDREAHPAESKGWLAGCVSTLVPMSAGDTATEVDTPLGTIGVEATAAGVRRVHLPGEGVPRQSAHGDERAAAVVTAAAEQLAEYANGEREVFDIELDWTGVEETHRRVLETLREIAPFGTTVTYGELGSRAGVDDPREVGVMMARNPLPLVVPCHRVVASDGLGGFGGGLDLKRRLLELEGVLQPQLELGV